MRRGPGMLLMIAITSSILLSCFPYNSGKPQDVIEIAAAKQNDIKPEERLLMVNDKLYYGTAETGPMGDSGAVAGKIASVSQNGEMPKQNGQSNFGGIGNSYTRDDGDGFIMVSIEDEWFCFYEQRESDTASYERYKSGALDSFMAIGSEVEQCVIADLDLDGRDDVLISCSIPDSGDAGDIRSYGLSTMILKGTGDGAYELAAENQKVNYYSSYDGSAALTAGDGWFKLTRARGTGGGYVYSYYFEYDQEKEDWFLDVYYNNWYGYTQEGRSVLQTPDNFGSISFEDFDGNMDGDREGAEGAASENELSVDETDFKISASTCYVTLQDKKKEYRMNRMITAHAASIIDSFRALNVNVDIIMRGKLTYETPRIICIEYSFYGTIGGDEMNYDGTNRKYITAMFDIGKARQITLSEIIDIEKLYTIMKQEEIACKASCSSAVWKQFHDMKQEECIELLKTSDSLQAALGTANTGIFSAVYEKSLCLYFQPEFIGAGPYCEEPMIYVPLKNILPEVKLNYWELPEERISRIEWKDG